MASLRSCQTITTPAAYYLALCTEVCRQIVHAGDYRELDFQDCCVDVLFIQHVMSTKTKRKPNAIASNAVATILPLVDRAPRESFAVEGPPRLTDMQS